MSEKGQTEKSGLATGKSALPSRTDIVSPACQVRKVPLNEPALTGGRWPGGRAHCVYRSKHLMLRLEDRGVKHTCDIVH